MTNYKFAVLLGCLFLISCAVPQVSRRVRLGEQGPLKVAVLPFENLSGEGDDSVGSVASRFVSASLVEAPQYEIVEDRKVEQSFMVSGQVSDSDDSGTQSVELTTKLQRRDPIEIGLELGVDAVIVGSVTAYKKRNMLIFPPASAGLEMKLINVKTRQVIWSVTHYKGYGTWRWLVTFLWPVGTIAMAVTSSTHEERLRQVCVESSEALLWR